MCVCVRERREIERGILIVRETVTSSVILNNRKQDKTGKKIIKASLHPLQNTPTKLEF